VIMCTITADEDRCTMNETKRIPRTIGTRSSTTPDGSGVLLPSSSGSSIVASKTPAPEVMRDAWLAGLSENTRRGYRGSIADLARSLGFDGPRGDCEALRFTLGLSRGQALVMAEAWARRMIDLGKSTATVQARTLALRSWLEFAESSDWGGPGPVQPRIRMHRERKIRDAPDLGEVARAVARLEARRTHGDRRDSAILSTLLVLALRRAELRALELGDLEPSKEPDAPALVRVSRKGGRVDRLALPRPAWRRLRSWLELRAPWIPWASDSWGSSSSDPVFVRWHGHRQGEPVPDRPRAIIGRDHIYDLTVREGLGPPHAIRRSAARWISEHGGTAGGPASVDHVRAALGHRDIRTTTEYLDSGGDDARAERVRLAREMERKIGK